MRPPRIERLRIGALAGLAIVIVTTLLNLAGRSMGWLPPVMDLSHMAEFLVDPAASPAAAWVLGIVVHVVSGVILGMIYAHFVSSLGPATGILFMLPLWLLMMVVGLPLVGGGWFGLEDGIIVPVATFTLNVIFGAGMGIVARSLSDRHKGA